MRRYCLQQRLREKQEDEDAQTTVLTWAMFLTACSIKEEMLTKFPVDQILWQHNPHDDPGLASNLILRLVVHCSACAENLHSPDPTLMYITLSATRKLPWHGAHFPPLMSTSRTRRDKMHCRSRVASSPIIAHLSHMHTWEVAEYANSKAQ